MPAYKCRLIREGRVQGHVTIDAPNDQLALLEAEDGINVLRGEWVEVVRADEDEWVEVVRVDEEQNNEDR